MIVTLTPNPSVDRTVQIPRLLRGEVLRATGGRVDPGGKGVNVARALLANGREALAVLPTGGREGDQLADLLAKEGVRAVGVPIRGTVRANITVAEPDGTVTKLNEPGPALPPDEVARLLSETVDAAVRAGGSWVVGCGSLSPGTPDDLYARLARLARDRGLQVAIDTSGTPLAAVIDERPDLVKPNAEELAELSGGPLSTLGDVADAAGGLLARGVGAVLVSLGPHGALLVTPRGAALAQPPPVRVASTVGAGDATLAGFLAARTRGQPSDDASALAEAVAWGTAAVALPGTRMPTPEDLAPLRARVRLDREPDRGRRLDRNPDEHDERETAAWTSASTT
jgi:1-phosphofructokinase family hexose kinase